MIDLAIKAAEWMRVRLGYYPPVPIFAISVQSLVKLIQTGVLSHKVDYPSGDGRRCRPSTCCHRPSARSHSRAADRGVIGSPNCFVLAALQPNKRSQVPPSVRLRDLKRRVV